MIEIIIGLITAFITILSNENIIINKKITSRIDSFYIRGELYIQQIATSTYKTASERVLIKTIQYSIIFIAIITFLTSLILSFLLKTKNTNHESIVIEYNDFSVLLYVLLFLFALRFGTENNFKRFLLLLKKDLIGILNSKILWLVIMTLEFIAFFLFYIIKPIAGKNNYLSNRQILDIIVENNSFNNMIILVFPILLLFLSILIYVVGYFAVCLFSKLLSFLFYYILKKVFELFLFLNDEKPLKTFLQFLLVLIIVITPIIDFVMKII